MGHEVFSRDSYASARRDYGVTHGKNVTRDAEIRARDTGKLDEIVDPAINPVRYSKIRLNAHKKQWIATVGCPMDIEVTCDTTSSMQDEVDTEMSILPDLYDAVAKYLPGYDPQLCLGIFGDCLDDFVMCRPQFEMEASKIVNYLRKMAPQRGGHGNHGEDPQYAMFARAYLTNAYTNNIGLKGYHFVVTDEPCHDHLRASEIERIFGETIFEEELKELASAGRPYMRMKTMIDELKRRTHQFILILDSYYYGDTVSSWKELCGEKSVIVIDSTERLPAIISAIIGLTEGTLEVTDLEMEFGSLLTSDLIGQLSMIDLGAQAKLRRALPYPIPKAGDIFAKKGDLWPIQPGDAADTEDIPEDKPDTIQYL